MDFIRKMIFISSAKIKSLACWRTETAEFTNRANRSGERAAPCGTPEEGVKRSEEVESTVTHWILFVMYERNQESNGSPIHMESTVDIR